MINFRLKKAEQPPTELATPSGFEPATVALRVAEAIPATPGPTPGALAWPPGKPRVLLLQGPVGPFFRRLQRRLVAAGFDPRRVSFNPGDRLFAGREGTTRYTGTLDAWPARFAAMLREDRPDLVVLFGAERPLHAAARKVAREAGVPVLCLEEGYQRPGWVTAELDGNNAGSPVAGRIPPEHWLAPALDEAGAARPGFRQACFYAASYYGAQALLNTARESGYLHRSVRASECFFFARNVLRKIVYAARDALAIRTLVRRHAGRYAVVALQIPSDSQLGAAARGWTNERLVETALAALAATPEGRVERLVVKIHPLVRGHTGLNRFVRHRARALGVADRVEVLHCGSAGTVIRHSAGLVTINSTAGLSAIFHGVPLVAVGRALYAHPALARSDGRDAIEALFRGEARNPGPGLRQRYLAWIRERCLVPGDFYSGRGTATACDNLAVKVAEICLPLFGRNDGKPLT